MSDPSKYRHPNSGELYTPCTVEFYELLDRMYLEWGSWRDVAWKAKMNMKVLRNLRNGERKCISMSLLDRMTTGTGVGSVNDFLWFTPDDLVALGIWKPVQYVNGEARIRGMEVYLREKGPPETDAERSRRLRKQRRDKRKQAKWSPEELRKLLGL